MNFSILKSASLQSGSGLKITVVSPMALAPSISILACPTNAAFSGLSLIGSNAAK